MRVLIVSHNVFSSTESMGKTLSSYFSDFDQDELAQFYIHSQIPTSDICTKYYRITDKEAILSIFGKDVGTEYEKKDIESYRIDARTDTGIEASIYQKSRKRTPIIYLLRNIWWKLSRWNNNRFMNWIDDFKPDCVFLASGDYAFIYDIALQIAQTRKIPLYVSCVDDFYIYNKNSNSVLGRWQHKLFMNSVHKAINYSTVIFCICEKMTVDYSKLFGKKCVTVHTPATIIAPLRHKKTNAISYLGNLGYQRDKQLIQIGKALKLSGLIPNHIDVYSSESRAEILHGMCEENGIIFHGSVDADGVLKVMGESLAVIHTESFNESIRNSVRYSVSTKIADSLMSGTCIFAYGPDDIASIAYLIDSCAAICCTSTDDLSKKLSELINNEEYRNQVLANAQKLSQNHSQLHTPQTIRKILLGQSLDEYC